ncbi:MAG TPA: Sua5/YciO/YrdC/YwlC family protein, partial [Rhodanobacteraceae bacterium]|nr:Sua5/YciO/YrdC/YwlC family protein [Rhodanobacteraceae bacterium]
MRIFGIEEIDSAAALLRAGGVFTESVSLSPKQLHRLGERVGVRGNTAWLRPRPHTLSSPPNTKPFGGEGSTCVACEPTMHHFNSDRTEAAAALLLAGGVLAYPTEGVYGLGCDPDNRDAFDRIFAMKRRPPEQGVLLIAADFEQVRDWIGEAPDAAFARARAAWPGAHTFIFPRSQR